MRRTLVGEVDARILPILQYWTRAESHVNKFSDGGNASYALDESNSGNHLGGGGNVPIFRTGVCNGYAAFDFNGSMDLRGSNVYTASVWGIYAVAKHNVAGNWVVGEGMLSDLNGGGISSGVQGDIGTKTIQRITASDTIYVNGALTNSIANTDAWNFYYIEYTGGAKSQTSTMMGRSGSTVGFFNGQIAECGYFGAIPSAQQRTLFFNSIIDKYKITGVP